jgi:hypothetical protein
VVADAVLRYWLARRREGHPAEPLRGALPSPMRWASSCVQETCPSPSPLARAARRNAIPTSFTASVWPPSGPRADSGLTARILPACGTLATPRGVANQIRSGGRLRLHTLSTRPLALSSLSTSLARRREALGACISHLRDREEAVVNQAGQHAVPCRSRARSPVPPPGRPADG